jgi:UDP-N-acetylmuramate--alanine ligase
MSALARVLLARGLAVSGSSDQQTPLTDALAGEGARVSIGHAAANLAGARTLVASSAIAPDNPELTAARARAIPIVRRGALLAELMAPARGVAIAGTHGKTTATAMIAAVLEAGDLDPTMVLGGELVEGGQNARVGASRWFVAESDESDGSFLDLQAEIAIVTNVENDHVASDEEMPRLEAAFERFLANLPSNGLAIVGTDDVRAARLAKRQRAARTRTFGFSSADIVARNPRYADFGSRFEVEVDGRMLGEIALCVPGAINVLDALPAIALAGELDIPFERVRAGLGRFQGVRRRFQIMGRDAQMTVVDDYAHHPTAVAATLAAARANWGGPIVVAFQPHRYSRTRYLAAEFARALAGAELVVLAPIYAASEPPLDGVDARSIGEPLARAGTSVTYASSVEDVPDRVRAIAPPGSLVLCLGAGTITLAARTLGAALA